MSAEWGFWAEQDSIPVKGEGRGRDGRDTDTNRQWEEKGKQKKTTTIAGQGVNKALTLSVKMGEKSHRQQL